MTAEPLDVRRAANPATPRPMPAPTFPAPDGVRGMTDADVRAVLVTHLDIAVPLHMGEMRGWTAEQRMRALPHGWQGLAGMADVLLFPAPNRSATVRRNTILSFNVYARGLAVLAYEPGGVNLFGGHWCAAEHSGCPNGKPIQAGEPWADLMDRIRWAIAQPEWQEPLRKYELLLDAEEDTEKNMPAVEGAGPMSSPLACGVCTEGDDCLAFGWRNGDLIRHMVNQSCHLGSDWPCHVCELRCPGPLNHLTDPETTR